jgi:hypothetical protein
MIAYPSRQCKSFILFLSHFQRFLLLFALYPRNSYKPNFQKLRIKESDDYDERDVENAIVAEIKKFIMMAGDGFCFIGNQYRLLVDEESFFIDMLFFDRNLQCLVAFELKKDKFRPADLGQLSFYLSALDKYVRKPNEDKTIGILLCQEMNRTVVELAVQDYDKPMGVATYRLGTGIPDSYKSLIPLIDGVQQLLLENGETTPACDDWEKCAVLLDERDKTNDLLKGR